MYNVNTPGSPGLLGSLWERFNDCASSEMQWKEPEVCSWCQAGGPMWAHSQSVTAVAGVVEQMAKNLKSGEDEGL